ncbi:hypothetical protein QQS21_000102 [Conoideocrella luteorostrata]|uniref:histone acetyltransferase n=1 Tax=Conoideocrella luteorostrata TaxID=1105319 RepID=A0AAJ0CZL6_9HYPO|nr:hypothetical protein QQS21_000102 [Conoideocrella luteorostrata]
MDPALPNPSADDGRLAGRLAAVLPSGVPFGIYHVSTPPRKTDALYSSPPNERPDRTYCENHFLAVSIDVPSTTQSAIRDANPSQSGTGSRKEVVVLGIEIFIYTTAHSTTLFVSKADSTGYLQLLNLPKGTPSPIREVCASFIEHLIENRRRRDVQFVVSLFARSQGQYLFPGSVDHGGKHVLDDWGLIKWWCRVLDPVVTSPPAGSGASSWKSVKGYLVVPGLDTHETRALIPRTTAAASSWSLAHPLEKISHYCREFDWVPPRCLIPRFPDDPKSRFRDELDEEAGTSRAMKHTGSWKSVKTLDMFWEMMAYRQECSSGRMTGFIWVVFDDKSEGTTEAESKYTPSGTLTKQGNEPLSVTAPNTAPRKLFLSKADRQDKRTPKVGNKSKKKKIKLRGPIKPRQPQAKTEQRNYLLKIPISTAYYYWPAQGRGDRVVNETTYKRITDLMLHTDFSTLDKAVGSSKRWINEVGIGSTWGRTVVGQRETPATAANADGAAGVADPVHNLSSLVKRKRSDTAGQEENGGVNVLTAGLVKRKAKADQQQQSSPDGKADVTVLNPGLLRKKPKT